MPTLKEGASTFLEAGRSSGWGRWTVLLTGGRCKTASGVANPNVQFTVVVRLYDLLDEYRGFEKSLSRRCGQDFKVRMVVRPLRLRKCILGIGIVVVVAMISFVSGRAVSQSVPDFRQQNSPADDDGLDEGDDPSATQPLHWPER